MKNIFILGFLNQNKQIISGTFELISEINQKNLKSVLVNALILTDTDLPSKEELKLKNFGFHQTYVLTLPKDYFLNIQSTGKTIFNLFKKLPTPDIFLFPSSIFTRSLAPVLATHFKAGLTADTTGLEIHEEAESLKLTAVRPAFSGNIYAEIIYPNSLVQMATVRQGLFELKEKPNPEMQVTKIETSESAELEFKLISNKAKEDFSFQGKEIIFDLGRGAEGSAKYFADFLNQPKIAVGATRGLVQKSLFKKSRQIGQTGSAVAPNLLICFGVSGSSQHLAGIQRAKKIISVNVDESAPLNQHADLVIVGDANEIIPKFINLISKKEI